jgi:hypothetical protein
MSAHPGAPDHDGPASPESGTPAVPGERAVPYHCPFCAEQDLRPDPAARSAWHCRACLRTFTVSFLGMKPIGSSPPSPADSDPADPSGAL